MMNHNLLLAGDIGGTKSMLALVDRSQGPLRPVLAATLQNRDFSGPEELLKSFLSESGPQPAMACFGVAGPVLDNRVRMTKLGWVFDGRELASRLRLRRVLLINDMVAMAVGAVLQPGERLKLINQGHGRQDGAIGILAPGTGLGQSLLIATGQGRVPVPTEGGHAGFAPRNREQADLLTFLLDRRSPVTVDSVCSGTGLVDLFAFLSTRMDPSPSLVKRMETAADPARVVIETALEENRQGVSGICGECVRLFLDILAAETSNLALRVLARGGMYIGGGLVVRVLELLDRQRFMDIFTDGVYADLLAAMPVSLLLDPGTPLTGAAAYGLERMRDR